MHLGLNAALLADVAIGRWAYLGASVQLLAIGHAIAPTRGYPVSAMVFAGGAFTLVDGPRWRLALDLTPNVAILSLSGSLLLSSGLVAGLRLMHRRGFTMALRLPVGGYAWGLNAPRASILYFYISSIVTVPIISFGYTFQ